MRGLRGSQRDLLDARAVLYWLCCDPIRLLELWRSRTEAVLRMNGGIFVRIAGGSRLPLACSTRQDNAVIEEK